MFPNHHWPTPATYLLNATFQLNALCHRHLRSTISLPHRRMHTSRLRRLAYTSLLQSPISVLSPRRCITISRLPLRSMDVADTEDMADMADTG